MTPLTTDQPTVIPNPGFHLSSYTVYDRPGQRSGSRAVYLCGECAAKRWANGTMASKWSGECINGYCDDCGGGPSVSHFRLADEPPAPTLTPTSAPVVTKRVGEYDPITKDYPAYVAIDDGPEEYIGSRRTQGACDQLCDEYAYHFYVDNHTPEKAVAIALTMEPSDPYLAALDGLAPWPVPTPLNPEPAPPVDDGPEDNFGGFRSKVNWSSAAARLARLQHAAAARRAQIADDLSPVLFELALTDGPALIELLRAHTAVQRDRLAWRFAAWLRRHHGIVREPAHIAHGWSVLIVGESASGVDRDTARPEAHCCAVDGA